MLLQIDTNCIKIQWGTTQQAEKRLRGIGDKNIKLLSRMRMTFYPAMYVSCAEMQSKSPSVSVRDASLIFNY